MLERWLSSDSASTQKALRYAEAYQGSKAEEYMEARGIPKSAADTFLLGYVPPDDDDQRFAGMLSIPYMTPAGCVSMKYRNLRPDAEPRYTQPAGQETHMYNVMDLHKPSHRVVICEGEVDAMTVSMLNVPAVGIPGSNNWKEFYYRVFDGYRDIVVLTDNDVKSNGDNPGQELASVIARELMGARNVVLPPGQDVNSFYLEEGPEALLKLIGVSP